MSPGDVDSFLLAKRQIQWQRYATTGILAILVIVQVVAIVSRAHSAFWVGAVSGTVVGALVLVVGERVAGPRDRLLEIVERQINADPAALRYLAARRTPN